jgi:hypothetical protein
MPSGGVHPIDVGGKRTLAIGYGPISWQGWLVIAIVVGLIVAAAGLRHH